MTTFKTIGLSLLFVVSFILGWVLRPTSSTIVEKIIEVPNDTCFSRVDTLRITTNIAKGNPVVVEVPTDPEIKEVEIRTVDSFYIHPDFDSLKQEILKNIAITAYKMHYEDDLLNILDTLWIQGKLLDNTRSITLDTLKLESQIRETFVVLDTKEVEGNYHELKAGMSLVFPQDTRIFTGLSYENPKGWEVGADIDPISLLRNKELIFQVSFNKRFAKWKK